MARGLAAGTVGSPGKGKTEPDKAVQPTTEKTEKEIVAETGGSSGMSWMRLAVVPVVLSVALFAANARFGLPVNSAESSGVAAFRSAPTTGVGAGNSPGEHSHYLDGHFTVYRFSKVVYVPKDVVHSLDDLMVRARKMFNDPALVHARDRFGHLVVDFSDHSRIRDGMLFVSRQLERFFFPAFRVGEVVNVALPDREVSVRTLSISPRIFEIEHFLTDAECTHFIETAKKAEMVASRVGATTAVSYLSDVRNSVQTWIGPGQHNDDGVYAAVRQRAAALTHLDYELCEDTQVVHYKAGAHYYAHHDYTDKESLPGNPYYEAGGNRLVTLLYYLNDVASGGETIFPYVNSSLSPDKHPWNSLNNKEGCAGEGFRIAPKKGAAVMFYNLVEPLHESGRGDVLTLHAGCDPAPGNEKYLTNQWIRNKRVMVNGKSHLYDEVW